MATCSTVRLVPGPRGSDGDDGVAGADGVNAYTTNTAQFTMPAEGADVTVTVGSSTWMVPTQKVYVQNAGYMEVRSKASSTSVVLRNVEVTASGTYAENVAAGTVIASGNSIAPAGIQGPSGSLSGAAGGDLEGTYPNPTLEITATKGDIIVNSGGAVAPRNTVLAVGTDGNVVRANSATGTGLEYGAVNLSGGANHVTNALPVANGGTGAAAAATARTNLGLGSIATQSAAAVAVTGGTINSTSVGNATQASGAFTTLSASSAHTQTGTTFTPSTAIQSLIAANPITPNATKIKVVGNGGAVTLTSTPTISTPASDGQFLIIQGTDNTNTITLQDEGSLAGSNLELGSASRVLGLGDTILLTFDSADNRWYEISFSNN